ncbi:MAG: phosphoadenylyl-sulfate reductase [Gallionella sp.]|nr:phosphoadenylyl-sulfate reductase [Gallionella sp.]
MNGLDQKVEQVRTLLAEAVRDFSPVVFASSLGAEDMVLTDIIANNRIGIDIFSLDTGRLPEETYNLMHKIENFYAIQLKVYFPDRALVEKFIAQFGVNGFYESSNARKECCFARKIEPLRRALAGKNAWVTGLRRDQAVTRSNLEVSAFDADNGLQKLNPLLEWTNRDVWAYIRQHDVPYNKLHDQFYPSLGCAPCTRSVTPGEDIRSGRWWWESPEDREWNLHVSRNSEIAHGTGVSAQTSGERSAEPA